MDSREIDHRRAAVFVLCSVGIAGVRRVLWSRNNDAGSGGASWERLIPAPHPHVGVDAVAGRRQARREMETRASSPRRLGPFVTGLVLALAAASATAADWQPFTIGETAPTRAQTRWFRAWVLPEENMVTPAEKDLWRDSMTLTFRGVTGTVSVWLNGQRIIEPTATTAEKPVRFKVPKGILEKGAFSAFVVRVDGPAAASGFPEAPIFGGYHDELPLGPAWEVTATEPAADELRATAQKPAFAGYTPADFRPSITPMQRAQELVRGKFVAPAEALAALKTSDDLVVEELLHEPQIAQPTHVSFDERGRVWISQYRQYPYPAGVKMISRDMYYRSKYDRVPPAPPHHEHGADVISVHEDTDGDGTFDRHRNVLTGLNMANAAVRGHGGLWVMNTPYLLFYPDADGDDMPDRDPEVRLSGFGLEDTHSVANGLAWGPDGWLYGAQGSTTTSRVVRPGVDPPDFAGVYNEGCMVWRYHPEQKIYEIFADGSGNTFGLSFDAEGRLYSGHNGGDTRGWHHVQSGLYLKQGKDPGKFGPSPNAFAFGEMPMMKSANSIPRFSHMLTMVEGPAMPARWRGEFFAIDPLHHHVVAAKRIAAGATFSTADDGFPLTTADETFRPVFIANAPDGSIYVADFREEYIAHGQNYQSQIDPDTGRLYRLRGKGEPLLNDVNLAAKTNAQLVQTLSHANPWHRQTAVRLLGERKAMEVEGPLKTLLAGAATHPALEALWALHGIGQLDEALAVKTLAHPSAPVRAWTIRLMGDAKELPRGFSDALLARAKTEQDAEVRCQMLSTARRLPVGQSLPLVKALAMRPDDVEDPFTPLMAWFTVESHCASNREAVVALFDDPAWWAAPFVKRHLTEKTMRRFAEAGSRQDLLVCARLLAKAPSKEDRTAALAGFEEAFKGRSLPSLPDELVTALAASGVASPALKLRQGDPAAVAEALKTAADTAQPAARRLEVVAALGETKRPEALQPLLAIAAADGAEDVRKAALGALSSYEDPAVAERLLAAWPGLPGSLRPSALGLLVSRPAWAGKTLDAVNAGAVAKALFSPDVLARLRAHTDAALMARVSEIFPASAPTASASLKPRLDEIRALLTSGPGDAYKGEPIFMTRCGACHTLFFKGGKIGPNLTAYQRDDLGTMLASIVDPNAEIREGFVNYLVTTRDGRTLSGFLADSDANGIVLRGFDGIDVPVLRTELAGMNPVGRSLMPEGLLDGLSTAELRDLFAYLRQSQPIVK